MKATSNSFQPEEFLCRTKLGKKLALSILTTALMVAFVGAFTQKTSKQESSTLNLRDVLEKVAKNKVRLKDPSKFELLVVDGKFAVRNKTTTLLIKGLAGCGVGGSNPSGPGGNCSATTGGDCKGCGKDPNDFCTVDPF